MSLLLDKIRSVPGTLAPVKKAPKKSAQLCASVPGTLSAVAQNTAGFPALARVKMAVRTVAAERLEFVRLVQQLIQSCRIAAPEACARVAATRAADFPTLQSSGHNGASQLTYNNFRRWVSRARNVDDDTAAAALCTHYRKAERVRLDADFTRVFNALYLNPNKLPLTVCYRQTVKAYNDAHPGVATPSLDQMRRQVSGLDRRAVVMARYGESALRNRMIDWIERDWSTVAAGDCVIGDSRTFDTRVRVADANASSGWRGVRPTIAALIDARSWYFSAWWITTDPVDADILINTLGLYLHGTGGVPPRCAYFDNGKDYQAQGFATPFTAGGIEHSIFAELGIDNVTALPYNARAKTIERAFRDMMQQYDKLWADYLGSRPGERTDAAAWFDKHPEELPSLQEFCDRFAGWLDTYHHTPKAGRIHKGASPESIWQSRAARPALSPERLELAMLRPSGVRKVDRGPSVVMAGRRYISDDVAVGDRVLVKTDAVNPDRVGLFTQAGAFLGWALIRTGVAALTGDDPAERARLGELLARQRRQIKEARTALKDATGGLHQLSPAEVLALPVGGDAPRLREAGSLRPVKGLSHDYRRLTVEPAGEPLAAAKPATKPSGDAARLKRLNELLSNRGADNPTTDDF